MVLEPRHPSVHNMLRVAKDSRGETLKQSTLTGLERPPKRQRLSEPNEFTKVRGSQESKPSASPKKIIADSEAETDDEIYDDEPPASQQTDLEQALPPIKTDREAIAEYESMRAAEGALDDDFRQRLGQKQWVKGKSSIYVDAFYLALETVLEDEAHLFNDAEMKLFNDWRSLSYEAQYLYVRLFLRKTSAWFRINKLGYYSDIGDMQSAIEELFATRELPSSIQEEQISPGELEPPEGTNLEKTYTFADSSDEHIDSLDEASSLLLLDELKEIAKEAKVQGKNKSELLRALRRTSSKQTAIEFAGLQRTDTEDSNQPSEASEREESPQKRDPQMNRDEHFTQKILAETGKCIRLSLAPMKLFERVHLVFYRSTEWTEKSLTTIILARIARRNFPLYIVSRSSNIFPSRSLLLEFEASLRTQFKVDNILEFNGTPTKDGLQVILDIFEEVYPRWKVLLEEEQRKEDSIYLSGEGAYLRRLSPAWVYTRIVHKGAYVLGVGKFKQHEREHQMLTELLAQRLFHASRRGAWYQRKALLEEHYMHALKPNEGRSSDEQKKHWKRIALATCEEGLEDNMVHLIYHYDLQKRVQKLEKSLKIAKRQQHEFGHQRLDKPVEVTIEGIRVEKRAKKPPPQFVRNASTDNGEKPNVQRRDSDSTVVRRNNGGKTIWIDPCEEGECNVESMCLSQYRTQGWKGYHSEGGVIRTLFALLFYDILFAYVPNVFQTPFQTCPLDLHTDAFYPTRMSEINRRLAEIANGEAERLVSEVWNREYEQRTCVVGLDWNFELKDIREICRCFEPQGLSSLCKIMAQEYAERGGGVPDLFLWRTGDGEGAKGEVKFSEVKSENDRLSDTQRLWIHVLTGAGIRVEVAKAVATEVRAAT